MLDMPSLHTRCKQLTVEQCLSAQSFARHKISPRRLDESEVLIGWMNPSNISKPASQPASQSASQQAGKPASQPTTRQDKSTNNSLDPLDSPHLNFEHVHSLSPSSFLSLNDARILVSFFLES
jgi:hypothetical protein